VLPKIEHLNKLPSCVSIISDYNSLLGGISMTVCNRCGIDKEQAAMEKIVQSGVPNVAKR
jgi:hypothetical protein